MSLLTAAGIASRECPEIAIRVASSRADRVGAFRLAYQAYLRADLCGPSTTGMRLTPHQLLAGTDILVAEHHGEIVSTLSLVRDGELGLPMETVYRHEVEYRRRAGLKLAEVTCLADRRRGGSRFFGLYCEMCRVMAQMAEQSGVDQLLIAVHPRHARMYCRTMAFQRFGDDRDYPAVNGNPAVALCLDLQWARRERRDDWLQFLGPQIPSDLLESHPLPPGDLKYFEMIGRQGGFPKAPRGATLNASLECLDTTLACA